MKCGKLIQGEVNITLKTTSNQVMTKNNITILILNNLIGNFELKKRLKEKLRISI